jgi:hypothetical protein
VVECERVTQHGYYQRQVVVGNKVMITSAPMC